MKILIWFLAWFLILTYFATAYTYGQLYPSDPPLLGELQKDAYGPGIYSDGTGRALYWQPQAQGSEQGPNLIIEPKVNQYGFGYSADQFGREIQPEQSQKRRSHSYQVPRWDWRKGGFTEAE